MALQDYDQPIEPLYRRDRNSFDDARRAQLELDKGTLWAGAMLGAALLAFIVYMVLAGPST